MEKYAVVIDKDLVKTGSDESHCPGCGGPMGDRDMLQDTMVWCKNCGTRPFEKRPPAEDKTTK